MATLVLVHGAWHGGWCWQGGRTLLAAKGHEVFTPTLTGLDERSHLVAMPCGHDVMVDMPRELANALMAAA